MIKKRTWEIVEAARPDDKFSRYFDFFVISLILLNVVAVIAGSITLIQFRYGQALYVFEAVSVTIFTVEYVLRVWSCTVVPNFRKPVSGRLRFCLKPLLLIDLLAILPFFLPFLGLDLRVMRSLRILRLIRIFKLARYNAAFGNIKSAISSKKEELLLSTTVLLLLLIVSSSLMYFFENGVQPEAFPDIPSSMWWSVVTLTTVGYGDVYPVTAIGKALAAVISILGIGMVALPTGIIGASFVEAIEHEKKGEASIECPHCGERVHL